MSEHGSGLSSYATTVFLECAPNHRISAHTVAVPDLACWLMGRSCLPTNWTFHVRHGRPSRLYSRAPPAFPSAQLHDPTTYLTALSQCAAAVLLSTNQPRLCHVLILAAKPCLSEPSEIIVAVAVTSHGARYRRLNSAVPAGWASHTKAEIQEPTTTRSNLAFVADFSSRGHTAASAKTDFYYKFRRAYFALPTVFRDNCKHDVIQRGFHNV